MKKLIEVEKKFCHKVLFPKFAAYLARKKYISIFPKESIDFFTKILEEIMRKRKLIKDNVSKLIFYAFHLKIFMNQIIKFQK